MELEVDAETRETEKAETKEEEEAALRMKAQHDNLILGSSGSGRVAS